MRGLGRGDGARHTVHERFHLGEVGGVAPYHTHEALQQGYHVVVDLVDDSIGIVVDALKAAVPHRPGGGHHVPHLRLGGGHDAMNGRDDALLVHGVAHLLRLPQRVLKADHAPHGLPEQRGTRHGERLKAVIGPLQRPLIPHHPLAVIDIGGGVHDTLGVRDKGRVEHAHIAGHRVSPDTVENGVHTASLVREQVPDGPYDTGEQGEVGVVGGLKGIHVGGHAGGELTREDLSEYLPLDHPVELGALVILSIYLVVMLGVLAPLLGTPHARQHLVNLLLVLIRVDEEVGDLLGELVDGSPLGEGDDMVGQVREGVDGHRDPFPRRVVVDILLHTDNPDAERGKYIHQRGAYGVPLHLHRLGQRYGRVRALGSVQYHGGYYIRGAVCHSLKLGGAAAPYHILRLLTGQIYGIAVIVRVDLPV